MSGSVVGLLGFLALVAEVGLVAHVVIAARRAAARLPEGESDAATRFRLVARQVLRSRVLGDVLTTEVMLLYYAFRKQKRDAGVSGAFTVHRTSTYVHVLVGIGMALIVETVAVHFLVRMRSPALAWVLTLLSLYTLLWLVGDYRALVARPIGVTASHLRFRYGLRWEADVPRDAVKDVDLLPPPMGPTPKEKGRLVVALPGGANLKLQFERPMDFLGLYGRRKGITELRVRVDEPEKLRAALRLCLAGLLLLAAESVKADTLQERIPPPPGYQRIEAADRSFGAWLRRFPLLPPGTRVLLYDGREKAFQAGTHAVLDLDVGERDLQQCADAVMRLRAEYLRASGCEDGIQFHFTSGDLARWSAWKEGMRPVVRGNKVSWTRTGTPDRSERAFRDYLDTVFIYAGSSSLSQELNRVADPTAVQPGDVFVQGGFPGHAVLVADVAEDARGRRAFLLVQSYMPAQSVHVLRNLAAGGTPWFQAKATGSLVTPEWTFSYTDLRRFPESPCGGNR